MTDTVLCTLAELAVPGSKGAIIGGGPDALEAVVHMTSEGGGRSGGAPAALSPWWP
jgi:hypothetical protein